MYLLGKITPCWDKSYKDLQYKKQPASQEELQKWNESGYNHTTVTGSMYDSKNIMPDWVEKVGNNFNLKNKSFTIYKMNTLDIMPAHVDHFQKYCQIFNVRKTKVKRAVVFLEDWKPGHYFEVDGKGIVNWSCGDYCLWEHYVEHAASNIGVEPRYTLQITGHV